MGRERRDSVCAVTMATAALEALSVSSLNLISIAGGVDSCQFGSNQEITRYEEEQYWW